MAPSIEDRYHVRRWHSIVQEIREVEGRLMKVPLLKAAVGVVIKNPFAGKGFVDELSSLTEHIDLIGHDLGMRFSEWLDGRPIEGYGKGGIAGLDGSQEHVVACVTTIFGDAFRDEVGGGKAWISSATKVGVPGVSLDIPLAYKDEVYVRSHYDAISFTVPDGPLPDEMVICVAVSSGERPHHRVGGMPIADVSARDSA
jgi:hypothetical protein